MNQTQRTFLTNSIEKQFKEEKRELDSRRPSAPSLNNYLVAAVLDGSFKLKSAESVRKAIHARVLSLGQKETLVEPSHDRWGNRRDEEDENANRMMMKLPADVIFDMPPGYEAARSKYDEEYAAWLAESKALAASFEAMKIKVQMGSDKALASLIDQADKLCSMSLTKSSQLLIENRP